MGLNKLKTIISQAQSSRRHDWRKCSDHPYRSKNESSNFMKMYPTIRQNRAEYKSSKFRIEYKM